MDDVEDKLVAQPKLAARHDCSLQTIWRRRKDPKLNFPEPVVINGRTSTGSVSLSSGSAAWPQPL
jgi:predicted DNA-binding transcriptional regulator AlpA